MKRRFWQSVMIGSAIALGIAIVCWYVDAAVVEPEPVKFTNPTRIEQMMAHDQVGVRKLLETVLDQPDLDAIEAALVPSNMEKLNALRVARGSLKRAGYANTDQVLVEVDAEITVIALAVAEN